MLLNQYHFPHTLIYPSISIVMGPAKRPNRKSPLSCLRTSDAILLRLRAASIVLSIPPACAYLWAESQKVDRWKKPNLLRTRDAVAVNTERMGILKNAPDKMKEVANKAATRKGDKTP